MDSKEEALEHKRQFETMLPQLLEVGEVLLATAALEDLVPQKSVYATSSGAVLDPKAVAAGRWKQLKALEKAKNDPADAARFIQQWSEEHQEQVAGRLLLPWN